MPKIIDDPYTIQFTEDCVAFLENFPAFIFSKFIGMNGEITDKFYIRKKSGEFQELFSGQWRTLFPAKSFENTLLNCAYHAQQEHRTFEMRKIAEMIDTWDENKIKKLTN